MPIIREHVHDGTVCYIEPESIPYIEKVLREFKPQLIIELGTAFGGFTKYLCNWFPSTPIYTVDAFLYASKKDLALFRKRNVTLLLTAQLFEGEMTIPLLCSLPLRKFLFCDNGQKDIEVRLFGGYLRPGDLLAVHDWSDYKQRLEGAFEEFVAHPINKVLKTEVDSDVRFFYKKDRSGTRVKPVNKTEHIWGK